MTHEEADAEGNPLPIYAVRLTAAVTEQTRAAFFWINDRIFQKKHPGPPLRVFLYRHGRNAWQILFTIHEAEGDDQAYVKLHQLRSATQKPLTKWPDDSPTI